MAEPLDFSVIIPSRNRPGLVARAIESVMGQSHDSLEALVVNDGSDSEDEYLNLCESMGPRCRLVTLPRTRNGLGQSYGVNTGAELARGMYLGFLDDDDHWIDSDHLARVYSTAVENGHGIDAYFSNQHACVGDKVQEGPHWLSELGEMMRRGARPDCRGYYRVTTADLLKCDGFCHPNTTVVKRSLFLDVDGYDEHVRCETDRDFYLRIIDRAQWMAYTPRVTSRHSVPDPKRAANMSTLLTDMEKMLDRARLLEKAVIYSRKREVAAHAMAHRAHTLKHMATFLHNRREFRVSSYYAGEALLIGFTWKWLLYYLYTRIRALLS